MLTKTTSESLRKMHQLNEISKFLSYVLRHEPQSIGLELDAEGWAELKELVSCARQSGQDLTEGIVQSVVKSNDKKRFSISDDGLKIRAVQGHSKTAVRIVYGDADPPKLLYHGTATRFLESIKTMGLDGRLRNHVHLSEDFEKARTIGQRHGKAIVLVVDAESMCHRGHKFFLAENGVWLTDHVPAIFLQVCCAIAVPDVNFRLDSR